MFTKLFNDILQSSLWAEDDKTRLVWITMLSLADMDGFVHSTAPGISNLARVSLDATRKALDIFESPDPDSRNPKHDGRRIERVPGGYVILNYADYRDKKSHILEREKTRERVRKHRAKEKLEQCNGDVTPCNVTVTEVTPGNDIQIQMQIQIQKDLNAILDSWNEMAEKHGLPKASKLTDKRIRQIKARLKEKGWDWKAALDMIRHCPFCIGENDRGWRADIDWFIKPDSVMKILEGKYYDAHAAQKQKEKESLARVLAMGRNTK